jgi:hypothetical protein
VSKKLSQSFRLVLRPYKPLEVLFASLERISKVVLKKNKKQKTKEKNKNKGENKSQKNSNY